MIGAGAGNQENDDEEKTGKEIKEKEIIPSESCFEIFADLGEPSLGGDLPPMSPGNISGCFNAPLIIKMIILFDFNKNSNQKIIEMSTIIMNIPKTRLVEKQEVL